jgi:cellulose synthase/poly-beta-1,6-N-acetylglucosamine synthase-like glycosyltransferase
MTLLFWLCVAGVIYPYLLYPALLGVIRLLVRRRTVPPNPSLPAVTLIIPVFNEEARIERKIANTIALDYPPELLQVLFVSDGSSDSTVGIIRATAPAHFDLVELSPRRGKAAALNAGLARARHDIVVFSDASIALEPESLSRIVRPFSDPRVGCVSGEDPIAGEGGGEGLYGRYELALRRMESDVHSIVGASGAFYAQRRALCPPFPEGLAPDFLSVLRTVEQGYRAISEPSALGAMMAVKSPTQEFERKVRTVLRGMTTLFANASLLNPLRYGAFAFSLWSHKLLRWTVPLFLAGALVSPIALLNSPLYLAIFVLQLAFYVLAFAAFREWPGAQRVPGARIALYFSSVNMAIAMAWYQYGRGVRQELWTPSQRERA